MRKVSTLIGFPLERIESIGRAPRRVKYAFVAGSRQYSVALGRGRNPDFRVVVRELNSSVNGAESARRDPPVRRVVPIQPAREGAADPNPTPMAASTI